MQKLQNKNWMKKKDSVLVPPKCDSNTRKLYRKSLYLGLNIFLISFQFTAGFSLAHVSLL